MLFIPLFRPDERDAERKRRGCAPDAERPRGPCHAAVRVASRSGASSGVLTCGCGDGCDVVDQGDHDLSSTGATLIQRRGSRGSRPRRTGRLLGTAALRPPKDLPGRRPAPDRRLPRRSARLRGGSGSSAVAGGTSATASFAALTINASSRCCRLRNPLPASGWCAWRGSGGVPIRSLSSAGEHPVGAHCSEVHIAEARRGDRTVPDVATRHHGWEAGTNEHPRPTARPTLRGRHTRRSGAQFLMW